MRSATIQNFFSGRQANAETESVRVNDENEREIICFTIFFLHFPSVLLAVISFNFAFFTRLSDIMATRSSTSTAILSATENLECLKPQQINTVFSSLTYDRLFKSVRRSVVKESKSVTPRCFYDCLCV